MDKRLYLMASFIDGKMEADLRLRSIDHAVALAIPVDVEVAGIFAGGDARITDAVGDNVIVFEESSMAVAKGDVAALVVPGGEARGITMRGGQQYLIGSRAMIGNLGGTVAA